MKLQNNDQALDYYFSGLRKDPNHFGCCYNLGVTFLEKKMHLNAQRWFQFAKQIDPSKKESYLGEAICAMKLGNIAECYKILSSRPGQILLSERRKKTSNEETNPTSTKKTTITLDTQEEILKIAENKVKKEGSILSSIDQNITQTNLIEVKLDIEN